MPGDLIFSNLEKLIPAISAHGQGEKFVFLKNGDTETNLTQFAYGKFQPGESCEIHSHETMEEFFYFLKGSGQYIIDGTAIPLKTGVFLRIPARIPHALSASGDCPLEFIYFGISTQ